MSTEVKAVLSKIDRMWHAEEFLLLKTENS